MVPRQPANAIIKTCGTLRGGMDDYPTENYNSTDKPASASLSRIASGSNYPLPPQGYCAFLFIPFSKLCHLTSNPLTFFTTAIRLATKKTLILVFSVAFGHPNRTRSTVPRGVGLWKALRESSPDSQPEFYTLQNFSCKIIQVEQLSPYAYLLAARR